MALASYLTNVPDGSVWYLQSVVIYSKNQDQTHS